MVICFIGSSLAAESIPWINFEDAPIIGTVQALAKSAGLDVVLSGDQNILQGKRATIHLKDISIEDAIESILRTNGFNYERHGKTLLISSLPQDLSQTGYKQDTENIELKFITAAKACEVLSKIFTAAVFQAGERANSLIIRGRGSEINEIKLLLSSLDKLSPQILIEGKIIELTQSDSQKIGISYGSGAIKFTTSKDTKKTALTDDINSVLNYLIAEGRATVVTSPRIATLDNQEALINIGSRIPYAVPVSNSQAGSQWTVNYIDAGVKLKITPQLGTEGYITTFIQPEVSSISEWKITSAGEFPVISTRNASATVRVKDGETIAIGGLLSENNRENVTKIPVLGYLPIIGSLFQSKSVEKEKTELVFLITPRVMY
jgi:type II secretory pathway component GspD/PulD (secretin)